MSTVIEAEGLGKKYTLRSASRESYTALRDVIARKATALNPFRRKAPNVSTKKEEFWALRNVTFDVKQGEKLGIVGRNGAGKSTLLKILTRITAPTTGRARLRGRVGSLLEVGTGFHPELTGRENIFLNGAILGMGRGEIKSKFDQIVDFAEIERFLDTPVKRYSSGMYVRLAFAVAAHLEPEVLLIDEVLAVGDMEFQNKCLRKMSSVAREGRTILFVSHNMVAVESLCDRGMLIDKGEVAAAGSINEVINAYMKTMQRAVAEDIADRRDRVGSCAIQFTHITVLDADLRPVSTLVSGREAVLALGYRVESGIEPGEVAVSVGVNGPMGNRLTTLDSSVSGRPFQEIPRSGRFLCRIPALPLVQEIGRAHV